MATFSYERPVHYYETDQMAIVHHSNYIRWLEEARLSLLEQLGLPYGRMEESGILIPVLSASCEYKLPFRFGDTFQIQILPLSFNGIKLKLSYHIFHKATGSLHATGETGHCFVDREFRPVRLKKEYSHIYAPLQTWITGLPSASGDSAL